MGQDKNIITSKELGAMEDVREVAYAYYEALKDKEGNYNKAAVLDFFNQMDKNGDDRISFDEFEGYLKTVDCAKYGSDKDFFETLAGEKKDYLKYCDVITLLYVINSGRPFCKNCKRFVEGSFFTCVTCFEKEKGYYCNFCPRCYNAGKNHQHRHKEFMDPVTLLVLKAKRESVEPPMIAKVTDQLSKSNISNNEKESSRPSSSNAIVVRNPQPSDESKKSKTSLSSSVSRPSNSNAIVVQNPPQDPPPSKSKISSNKVESRPSSSNAIVERTPPPSKPKISNNKVESRPSSSNAIVVRNPQIERPDRVLKMMEYAVAWANIATFAANFCTIM